MSLPGPRRLRRLTVVERALLSSTALLALILTLLVVTPDYARFYGVVSGLSTTTLVGEGWAVGVMSRHPLV